MTAVIPAYLLGLKAQAKEDHRVNFADVYRDEFTREYKKRSIISQAPPELTEEMLDKMIDELKGAQGRGLNTRVRVPGHPYGSCVVGTIKNCKIYAPCTIKDWING
ncbi:MAG TPA: hypothetical protein DCS05_08595 [Nitrospiraceae bacterium]|nr:hypothetical protein [Nitrospiraceae bacterium]